MKDNQVFTAKLGYRVRIGGGLETKVFGCFIVFDEDENDGSLSQDNLDSQKWAAKHNQDCQLYGKPFTFEAKVPETQEEETELYQKFLNCHKTGMLLYR